MYFYLAYKSCLSFCVYDCSREVCYWLDDSYCCKCLRWDMEMDFVVEDDMRDFSCVN